MRQCYFVAAAFAVTAGLSVDCAAAAEGAEIYSQNCMMCHQSGGAGLPGQFPRLAGRAASIASSRDGRSYLVDVLTFGLSGSITVDGQSIVGFMPAFKSISDEDVAVVLSYVSTLGNSSSGRSKPFTADEVKDRRQARSDADSPDIAAERSQLRDKKVVPP
jgi:mono/diheme cytochrome c family protein